MHGESERCGLANCVVTKGLLGKVVKPPGLNITFELTVPSFPVVFQKPGAELRKLVWGERLNLLLDLLDLTHAPSTSGSLYHPPVGYSKTPRLLANAALSGRDASNASSRSVGA